MRKKIKFDIPQNKKINLENLSNTNTAEITESYTTQIQKIKQSSIIPKKNTRKITTIQILRKLTSIISVVVFILLISTITIKMVGNIKTHNNEPSKKEHIKLSNTINGSWQSANNGLFVFNKDNTFYWYNSFEKLNDNYYKGTYNYKTGKKALKEMGFTEEEFKKEYGANIKLENIYSINLMPNQVLKNKIDITSVEINDTTTWWYILIINEDNTANGFNKTLDIKYNLIKKAD